MSTEPQRPVRQRFDGRIAGVGSTSGVRVVVGWWDDGPLGSFADCMVAGAGGHRVLLAPSQEVADFVGATYVFDEVRIEAVTAAASTVAATDGVERWAVRSPSLHLDLDVGARTPLGQLLRLVPARLARTPAWCAVIDPVARVVLRGVRTRGTAGGGRREWYGATDVHRVLAASGRFDGEPLGSLAPVEPSPRFGFSSTPRRPSVTHVSTTIESPRVPG